MADSRPVPPEAVTAAAEAIHNRSHEGSPCTAKPMIWHVRDAEVALEAAAPVIRADERKRTHGEITRAIERIEGLAAAAQAKAIAHAVAAERKRIRQLAGQHHATYMDDDGGSADFAGLIGDDRD